MKYRNTIFLILLVTLLAAFVVFPRGVYAAVSYTYDANGNLTSDGKNCYTYNDANQIKQVKLCAGSVLVAEYLYDYQGNRIVKKEYQNGSLKHTVYTPDKSVETKKLADNSVQNTSYYYVNDELVARKNPDSTKVYYHNDHLGSASVLTDQNGNFLEETTYYPYGEIRSGGTQSKYLYTGKEKDTESGLNYYGARYYDAHTRQFTQPDSLLPDPYDPQQLNRYSYTRGNPLKYTDPTGHWAQVAHALGMYALAIATSPDFYTDTGMLAQSFADFQLSNPASGIDVVGNAISLAVPKASFGPGTSMAIKTGGKTAMKGADAIVANSGKIAQSAKKIGNDVVTDSSFHGNDLRNTTLTVGYTLRDKATESIMKFGETINVAKRYPQKWLKANELKMQPEIEGTKREMHIWQHEQILDYTKQFGKRPSLNKSNW